METMETLQKLKEEVSLLERENATLAERNRIMREIEREIEKQDLSIGVWPLIKDIINPPELDKEN